MVERGDHGAGTVERGGSGIAAGRDGVAAAVRAALAQSDRTAYQKRPEKVDGFWSEAEAWSNE